MIIEGKNLFGEKTLKWENSQVALVVGRYEYFNRIVIDAIKKSNITEEEEKNDTGLLAEFGLAEDEIEISGIKTVDIEEFMGCCKVKGMYGKWYCYTNLGMLTQKQLSWIIEYAKAPSIHSVLVIEGTEYSKYKDLMNNKAFARGNTVNLFKMFRTGRKETCEYIKVGFGSLGVDIDNGAAEIFRYRMGGRFELYSEYVNKLAANSKGQKWTKATMESALGDTKHYSKETIVELMLKGTDSLNFSNRSKLMKQLLYLIEEFGAKDVVEYLRGQIEELIKYRMLMNMGKIPYRLRYNIEKVKESCGLDKVSNGLFKMLTKRASEISLEELYMIQRQLYEKDSNYQAMLYRAMLRRVLTDKEAKDAMERTLLFDT